MTNVHWPTPEPNSVGPYVGRGDVRDAVKATILEWESYYLTEISARELAAGNIGGKDQPANPLPPFGTWVNEPKFRNIGTGQPASFLVTVPATVGKPVQQGSGLIVASWRVQVDVRVFGTSWEQAEDLVNYYEAVVLWSLLQHGSLGGVAVATDWAGSQYTGEEHTSTRTEGHVILGFDVMVQNVLDTSRGPSTVPTTPPGQDPTVLYPITTVARTPDDQPLP